MTLLQQLGTMSDAQQVHEFWKGNPFAMEAIEERHNPWIKKYIHTKLQNVSAEQEVLQKFWIRVAGYLGGHRYEEYGKLKQWLSTRAHQESMIYLQNLPREFPVPEELLPEVPVYIEEPHFLHEEYVPWAREEILKMNPLTQEILRLRFEEDMLFPDIDKVLGLKPDVARVYCNRAIQYLRRQLEKRIGKSVAHAAKHP